MKEKETLPLPEAPKEEVQAPEEMPGIFISKERIQNMDMERIMVANYAVAMMLEHVQLNEEEQMRAVDKLVDRTPNWLKLKPEVQMEKIKSCLRQETVIEYLRSLDLIRKNVDMVESGIDNEGSVVVRAFYTEMNREMRRMLQKNMKQEDVDRMEQAVNILESDSNLVDLAAERIKRMAQKGKKK